MTKRECVIVTAYTGVAMVEGDDLWLFYEYLSELFNRPVYTHEIPFLAEEIKRRSTPDFIALCREAVT
jgi:hypothetical protein